jgi:type IV pilus biogenesis protein CpaD/CtpE
MKLSHVFAILTLAACTSTPQPTLTLQEKVEATKASQDVIVAAAELASTLIYAVNDSGVETTQEQNECVFLKIIRVIQEQDKNITIKTVFSGCGVFLSSSTHASLPKPILNRS